VLGRSDMEDLFKLQRGQFSGWWNASGQSWLLGSLGVFAIIYVAQRVLDRLANGLAKILAETRELQTA